MAAKALDVSLTDGKLGRIDVLVPADLSLYGATGKAPLGDGSNKLDASWLPDLDGAVASAIGLPEPQYDSGWVTFTAGTELVLTHGLGTQPVLFIITYRDNYDTPIEKALTVTNYPVGVWRQRITTSLFLLYTSWSYVAYNDAGYGLASAPVRVRAWRSGAVSGGALSSLTVKEADGSPSVSNVTEIRVPASWLTDLGGGAVLLSVAPSGSPLSVSEQDGTPAITGVVSLLFPNDSLTDLGSGVVQIDLASGTGGSSGPITLSRATPVNVRVRKTTSQALTAASANPITFNVEDRDVSGTFDLTTSRWTPGAGLVHIVARISYTTSSASGHFQTILKNGVELDSVTYRLTDTGNAVLIEMTAIDLASASDYYSITGGLWAGGTCNAATFEGYVIPDKIVSASGGGSGGGLTNPMTAEHDMVVGSAAATTNHARPGFGASGDESAHYYDGWGGDYHWPKAIDANDATYWSPGPCAGNWLRIDLGSAKLITAWRVAQEAAHLATAFKIQSSDDGSAWVDQAAIVSGVAESGVAALLTPTLARYWRLLGITGPPGSGYNPWLVGSFELHTGTPPGTPSRLAIGAEGTVLTVVGGAQAWATAGSSPGLLLYLADTFR